MNDFLPARDVRHHHAALLVGRTAATQGVEPGKLTGSEFVGFVDAEIKKWDAVVKTANVPLQE